MSLYKGHVVAGAVSFIPAFAIIYFGFEAGRGWVDLLILFTLCMMFAIFPDIDIKSKSQLLLYRIFIALDILLILLKMYEASAVLGLFCLLPLISRHRGWTHSRITAFLLPIPFLIFPMMNQSTLDPADLLLGLPYYLACLAGYLSHLAMDRKLF